MSQWKNTDNAANSVTWAAASVKIAANSDNQANLYGNTTVSAFINNVAVGQFGVDTTEMGVSNNSVVVITVTSPGSGYFANATVTVGGNATANAQANSTGRISAVNVTAAGNTYVTPPTVTVAAPAAQSFNANSAVVANGFISITSNKFQDGDKVTYLVAAGNTAITELANNTQYYITASNSTGVYLTTSPGVAAKTLTKGLTEAGHSLTGETATAKAVISGIRGAHAGYVLRTVGTGGRAGRVSYETLVAMGSLSGDAEDTIMKDA